MMLGPIANDPTLLVESLRPIQGLRRRNADATRLAILKAARLAFSAHGFDQVGVRDITAAAGVNASLINRYFGTKQKLFAEAMQVPAGLVSLLGLDAVAFPRSLIDYLLEKNVDENAFDPMIALIRSAPIEQAQPILRDYLEREAIQPLATRIGGSGAEERAGLLVSFLIGLTLVRGLIRSESLASTNRNDIAVLIERIVVVALSPALAETSV